MYTFQMKKFNTLSKGFFQFVNFLLLLPKINGGQKLHKIQFSSITYIHPYNQKALKCLLCLRLSKCDLKNHVDERIWMEILEICLKFSWTETIFQD